MVKLKNNSILIKHFVLLLTFLLFSCGKQNYYTTKIEGSKIGITEKITSDAKIDAYLKPYREHIDQDLKTVLAYCPETLDKSKGEFQTAIGCFLADITLNKSNAVFQKRENKTIDFCILNHGGIRSILPKGDVTARTAYEIMPFENSAIVVELKGEQVLELCQYFIREKKPHPLSGIQFTIDKANTPKNITIQSVPLDLNKTYYVVTSDYLSNGGDNMDFFKKGIKKYDIEYKLRNILIDYFKDVDTIQVNNSIRVTKEQ